MPDFAHGHICTSALTFLLFLAATRHWRLSWWCHSTSQNISECLSWAAPWASFSCHVCLCLLMLFMCMFLKLEYIVCIIIWLPCILPFIWCGIQWCMCLYTLFGICRCAFVSTSDLRCADSGSARGSSKSSTMTGSTSAMSHTHTHNTAVRSRSGLVTGHW